MKHVKNHHLCRREICNHCSQLQFLAEDEEIMNIRELELFLVLLVDGLMIVHASREFFDLRRVVGVGGGKLMVYALGEFFSLPVRDGV